MPIVLDGDVVTAPPVLPAVKAAPPSSVTVTSIVLPVVAAAPPATATVTVLPVAGPTGPQGPPGTNGTPGGSAFVYTRDTPAATWVIDHDLARRVHVTVFNDAGTVIHADIDHGTINQTTITFPSPVTGSVVIS